MVLSEGNHDRRVNKTSGWRKDGRRNYMTNWTFCGLHDSSRTMRSEKSTRPTPLASYSRLKLHTEFVIGFQLQKPLFNELKHIHRAGKDVPDYHLYKCPTNDGSVYLGFLVSQQ